VPLCALAITAASERDGAADELLGVFASGGAHLATSLVVLTMLSARVFVDSN